MATADLRQEVRSRYAGFAKKQEPSCCGTVEEEVASCCGATETELSKGVGYTDEDLESLPEGANLGLGCGNPVALASLKEGQTVLDLGSGAGIDCFLAAKQVGKTGTVIGVDMTHEMLARARENAEKGGYANVEFRLGEIEALPVADNTVDVVISNCVINLSPEKDRVFSEVFRVLKPGGQCFVSDIVLLKPLPEVIVNSPAAYTACVGGASMKDKYIQTMKDAGLGDVRILSETSFPLEALAADPTIASLAGELKGITPEEISSAAQSIVSAKIVATKPE